jgi:Holliday junction resolvase
MGNTQKQALQFENDVAADIWRRVDEHTVVRAGYSGNSVMPLPDVFIRSADKYWDTAVEIKKASSKGREEVAIKKGDVVQLWKFAVRNPTDTNALFALKFSSREPFTLSIPFYKSDDRDRVFDRIENNLLKKIDFFDYRKPNDEKYIVEKPSLDNWESARSGDDMADVIISTLP